MTTSRDDVHRLIDAVPDEQLAAVGEAVRRTIADSPAADQLSTQPRRSFASAGTLSGEHDLAERVEEILRTEPGAAV